MKTEQVHRHPVLSSSSNPSQTSSAETKKKPAAKTNSSPDFSTECEDMKQKHDRVSSRSTSNQKRQPSLSTSRGKRTNSSSASEASASISLRKEKLDNKSSCGTRVAAKSIASSSTITASLKSKSSQPNNKSSVIVEKPKTRRTDSKDKSNEGKSKSKPNRTTPSVTKKLSTLSTSDASVTSNSSSISSSTAVSVDDYMSEDQERTATLMSTKLDAVAERLMTSLSNQEKDAILELLMMQDGANGNDDGDEILGRILPSTNAYNTNTKTKKLQRSQTTRSEATTLTFSASDKEVQGPKKRPIIHDGSYYTAVYMGILLFVIGYWFYESIKMSQKDGLWGRCAWFVLSPLFIGMAMFPFRIAIYNTLALFGSWRNVKRNSRYHSYFAPPKPEMLPPVCVQMPVYKEDFAETIAPSLENIELAMDYYRSQGGQAVMFVNDDGLQLLDEEKQNERLQFYNDHNIAYIARPPPSLLVRHGLFKKASNMNFCLNFALELAKIEEENAEWSESQALQHLIDSREYHVLAGGPISRLSNVEYILLVDSDTRVPIACLHDTVGEFVEDSGDEAADTDKVGFVQHATSVLRLDDNYWEDMLAHFTHLLYSVFIPMGTACGEPSPLVGHNATLNWKAVQQVSWFDDEVGYRKFWSESHVSEDFDLSLRLQSAGYIGRYAMYTGPDFQEGVSVTVHDEIKKLRKFAYGSGEMLFNPLSKWLCHGPISPLIWRYLRTSTIPLHARLNLMAYLITYIAMAYGIVSLPLVFYLAVLDGIDMNLPTPWELMIGTFFIFAVVGSTNVILLALFFGHHSSFLVSVVFEVRHLTLLAIFYMGVQWHVFTAFFTYMFGMKAEWGATVKELDDYALTLRTFLSEVVKTVRAYSAMYIFIFAMAGFFTYFFMFGPFDNVYWSGEVMSPFIVFMAAHASMPVLFNPAAMRSVFESFCCSCRCFLGEKRRKNNTIDHDDDVEEPAKIQFANEEQLPDV